MTRIDYRVGGKYKQTTAYMFAKFVEITSCKVCTSYTSLEQYITAEDTVGFFAVKNNASRRMTRYMDSFQLGIAESNDISIKDIFS